MGKYYEIPCSWEVYGTLEVEASRLEEAIAIAEADDAPIWRYSCSPSTNDFNYVDGSFEVDRDIAEEMNKDE